MAERCRAAGCTGWSTFAGLGDADSRAAPEVIPAYYRALPLNMISEGIAYGLGAE
jgi:hypothetical protein